PFLTLLFIVLITEKENKTVVEGKRIDSPRTEFLMKPPVHADPKACPLCKLNLKRLNYTDVLILKQFINSDGSMMSLADSGLCGRKYRLVSTLVQQAQKCRLLPCPEDTPVFGPWEQYNRYIDFPKRYRDQPMRVIKKEYWK
ncbi:28S ribosomal protein S18a-like protein, partial [Leptotrombidium deliense]